MLPPMKLACPIRWRSSRSICQRRMSAPLMKSSWSTHVGTVASHFSCQISMKKTPPPFCIVMSTRTFPVSRLAFSSLPLKSGSVFLCYLPQGTSFSISFKNSSPVIWWPYIVPLFAAAKKILHWRTFPVIQLTRLVMLLRIAHPALHYRVKFRPANWRNRTKIPPLMARFCRSSVPTPGNYALCLIALAIRLSISWSRTM